jgi:hypothetical protein
LGDGNIYFTVLQPGKASHDRFRQNGALMAAIKVAPA